MGNMTPPQDPSSPMESGIRKRVCKACDRCRLKKSKCDGSSPCSRCKADNAICFFGERKKSHDKVYPKGYGEMLENQQAQLVAGLQELYRRLQQGQSWTGAPLKETTSGSPLTHDILESLGALKQEGQTTSEAFEENLEVLQRKLLANGAGFMQRQPSFDGNSDIDQSSFDHLAQNGSSFMGPFASAFPPTPPSQSPHPSSTQSIAPLKTQIGVDMAQMQHFQDWTPEFSDSMDFMPTYDTPSDMSMNPMAFQSHHLMQQQQQQQGQGVINPCLTMKNWEQQDMQRYFNTNVLV